MKNESVLRQQLFDYQQKLEVVEETARDLNDEIRCLQKEIGEKQALLKDLEGSWSRRGIIGKLKNDIGKLKLEIDHCSKPKVVWKKEPMEFEKDYIVKKVTAKRIYVGSPGTKCHTLYDKNGIAVGYKGNEIDIEATFGGPCPVSLK